MTGTGLTDGLTSSEFNQDGELESIGVGSPLQYGAHIQAGSSILGNGSYVTITFENSFAGVPFVTATRSEAATTSGTVVPFLTISGTVTTGFDAYGFAATIGSEFNWLAVGL